MSRQVDLSIVVPAYNEVASIADTLHEIRGHLLSRKITYELIVSADGDDGTREKVAELARTDCRLQVLGTPERRGKGRGVREGVLRSSGRIIGFVDADNKTPIAEVDQILPLFSQGYDVVIGSRAVAGADIKRRQPLYRRLGSRCFRIGMRCLTGLWTVQDSQCGFKFFRAPVARDLFGRQRIDGYMFDVEILYLAQRAGYRLKEVGVRWRDDGDSRLQLVRGNIRNLLDLFTIRFGRKVPQAAEAFGGEAARRAA